MISNNTANEAFVWVWLPGETNPVVAGRVFARDDRYLFNYGQSYLARGNAISLSLEELPLGRVVQEPLPGLTIPGCVRDACPDAWGRRVIVNKLVGARSTAAQSVEFDELTYMLESGSDRTGALDFQASPEAFVPRQHEGADLAELLESAERVEQGIPLTAELDLALQHGTSVGGARPKATLTDGKRKLIAKFPLQSDTYNVVKGEFLSMRLATLCGINVAPVELVSAMGKDVLLIERFDRLPSAHGWQRRSIQSALTLLRLDEMMARYASYQDLAEIIRHKFQDPTRDLHELFARLVFNILCGNNDDHARNHAAFWDGESFELTPAFDICPQHRTGGETSQAMLISGDNRSSKLVTCVEACANFLLGRSEALALIEQQLVTIRDNWRRVCDEARLSETERSFFVGRQFFNPYAFEGLALPKSFKSPHELLDSAPMQSRSRTN